MATRASLSPGARRTTSAKSEGSDYAGAPESPFQFDQQSQALKEGSAVSSHDGLSSIDQVLYQLQTHKIERSCYHEPSIITKGENTMNIDTQLIVSWYRSLSPIEQIAIEQYLLCGDSRLLDTVRKVSSSLNRFHYLAVPNSANQTALHRT